MAWFFWMFFLWAMSAPAKKPYYVSVCGVSRTSEEVELALELSERVLMKKCQDKNLDAEIKITSRNIEAFSSQGLLLVSRTKPNQGLSENQAKKFVSELLKKLEEKPEKKEEIILEKPEAPLPIFVEVTPPMMDVPEEQPGVWQLESLASLDQWNYRVSTKFYPGVQLGIQYRFLEDWELESRLAFGTSSFQVQDRIAWNQQFFVEAAVNRNFKLSEGCRIGPQIGYLYWGSFSGAEELPSFGQHDVQLGFKFNYQLPEPKLDFGLLVSAFPVNLGLQNRISIRYYFIENWFVSLQGNSVFLWALEPTATFLSASLGLGVNL